MSLDRTDEVAWLAQREGQLPEDCITRNIVSGKMRCVGKE